jgi:hypothetical protein
VSTELINTLLIIGAAQGLFLAMLLATKHANSAANKLLAVAMIAFSVFLLEEVYYARGYYVASPHFIGLAKPLVFLFGPILYLYARAVSSGGEALSTRSLLHFLPFTVVTLYFLPFYLQDGPAKIAFLNRLLQEGPPFDLALISTSSIRTASSTRVSRSGCSGATVLSYVRPARRSSESTFCGCGT